METTLAKPFTNIAISLSGGGYRATAFHLGALSYLHQIDYEDGKLFDKITTISTISGGTLTGVMVALYLAKGKSFNEAYQKLYGLLEKDQLLSMALNKANNINNWDNPTKTKNLINAFSEVYNKHFYDEATYQTLFDGNESQLKDIIFGSTELSFGQQFRFQKHGKFGNFYLNLPDKIAGNIRLADAAASSSCFPGGFEPMKMPFDYSSSLNGPIVKYWEEKEAEKKESNYRPTGIMDGGIIDNQGIEGVLLTEKRRDKDASYTGTFIVSDVSGKNMQPYEVMEFKRNWFGDFFTFRNINYLITFLTIFIIGSLIFVKNEPEWVTILSTIVLTFFGTWLITFLFLQHHVTDLLRQMIGKEHAHRLFDDFGVLVKTPVYILAYLAKVRITSLLTIVNNVFMRRIRGLQIQDLFHDDHWNYRVKVNNIYTLQNRTYALDAGKNKEFKLSPQIKKSVKIANSMPTTLWFSTEDRKQKMLENLIACGQFTVCRNLMRYIQKIKSRNELWESLTANEKSTIDKLDKQLRTDFQRFNEIPLWLVDLKKRA